MLKKCTEAIAKLPLKRPLPQSSQLQPLSYRISSYEGESLSQSNAEKHFT